MFKTLVMPVLALGGMGALFALLLSVASKIFKVDKDERIDLITEALPGANCGGCGFPGCSALASAVVEGKAPVNGCPVGGAAVAAKVAEIMGVSAGDAVREVAHVNCVGGVRANKKFEYQGISDCIAASKVQGGQMQCAYACLGLGTCVKACPYGAIEIIDGVAHVDEEKCKSCKKCVASCPKNLISMVPETQKVFVNCSNHDKGVETRNACSIGCIGCMLCVKACEFDAIHVENFCAVIDYTKCTNCGKCATVCPRKLISNFGKIEEPVEVVAEEKAE